MNYWIIQLFNNWIIFKSTSPKSITQTYQNKKYVHILLRRISVQIHLNFLLMNALVYVDIDQGIHLGKDIMKHEMRNPEFLKSV